MMRLGVLLLLACGAVGGVYHWKAVRAEAQPPAQRINADISRCMSCHVPEGSQGYRESHKSHEHVLLNESITWKKHDPHSRAFAVLDPNNSKFAARMQEQLRDRYGDLTKAPACLTCHAIDKTPFKPLMSKGVDDFVCQVDYGVNCNSCHGLGAAWQADHQEPGEWRKLTPAEKSERGMINLRDPIVKAEHCASCHVGNPAQGRVLTHEMYAAGHPPLWPLELATYLIEQPRHWGTPFDDRLKFFESLSPEEARKFYSYFKEEGLEGYTARDVALGVLAGLKAEADLLAADAQSREAHQGLDFARFDCYACHHELKLPSDRQNRAGPPGRPPVKAWNGALAGAIARHAEGLHQPKVKELAQQFDLKWQAVRAAAWARPYGDPRAMAAAAKDLADWCTGLMTALQQQPLYSRAEAVRLRQELQASLLNPAILPDGEAVMALTWAAQSLDRVLGGKPTDWNRLDDVLLLRLRPPSAHEGNRPVTVGELLVERMRLFNAYDASKFSAAFRDLFAPPDQAGSSSSNR